MPPPYPSLWSAWKEIAPALWRQRKDPSYCVKRFLPPNALPESAYEPAAHAFR